MAKRVTPPASSESVNLVPFSVRLPADLMADVTLIAAKRKVAKSPPYTHQAIAIDAMKAWVEKNRDGGEKRGK